MGLRQLIPMLRQKALNILQLGDRGHNPTSKPWIENDLSNLAFIKCPVAADGLAEVDNPIYKRRWLPYSSKNILTFDYHGGKSPA
jgi:hypothetical protein